MSFDYIAIGKRFAKAIPADFDFYKELEEATASFALSKGHKTEEAEMKIACFFILLCYGMVVKYSAVCAMLMVEPLLKLQSDKYIELALKVWEREKYGNNREHTKN